MQTRTIWITVGSVVAVAMALWFFVDAAFEDGPRADVDESFTQHEAGFEPAPEAPAEDTTIGFEGRYSVESLRNWERPDGPLRVALQVGHLENNDMPEELSNLSRNGAGATWGNLTEREVAGIIAEETADMLRASGLDVDVLPATIPPGYYADAFVSIHADGNPNAQVRGFKTAHFSHDYSGRSQYLDEMVNASYAGATDLPEDPRGTYRMTGYYAFNWWRYEHALHPMTPAIILETGFLTNAADRDVIVDAPQQAAQGIADGVKQFLDSSAFSSFMQRRIMLPDAPFEGRYACLEGRWDANDPPEERNAPCRPGLVGEGGARYGFALSEPVSTTDLLSGTASGTAITVEGEFTPMVGVRDITWYDYQVRGVIEVSDIRRN